ncbi:MAG: hypothetical protein ACYCW6_18350 [Candidatus Xenobia bacterium]
MLSDGWWTRSLPKPAGRHDWLAEEDLRQGGPGDFYGTRQAGFMELRVADLVADATLLDLARAEVHALLERDPTLHDESWMALRLEVERMFPGSPAHFR